MANSVALNASWAEQLPDTLASFFLGGWGGDRLLQMPQTHL